MQVDEADSRSEQESSPEERPAASTEIQMGMSPAQDAVEEPQDSWGHGPEAEGESAGPKRFSLFDDDGNAEHVSSAAAASTASRGEEEEGSFA